MAKHLNSLFDENSYVRELSIQDHCHEIQCLYDELRLCKARGEGRMDIEETLRKEETDLMLILMVHNGLWIGDSQVSPLVRDRIFRFREKEKNDGDKQR